MTDMTSPDDDGRIWTAAELECLPPDRRDALIRRRHQETLTVDDLDPAFAEQVRATAKHLVEEYLSARDDDSDPST